MPKRGGVQFVEQDEPAFLKRFKARVGYQEPTSVEDKFTENQEDGEERPDQEDEKPQVVVLKPGDLTAEEADKELEKIPKEEDLPYSGGKITFKKPVGETEEKSSDLKVTSGNKEKSSNKKIENKTKAVKNKCLLSFDDEEEEED